VYASGLGVVPHELDDAERCALHRRSQAGPLFARWAALARAVVTTGGRAPRVCASRWRRSHRR